MVEFIIVGYFDIFCNRAAKRLLSEIVEKGRPSPAFHHNDGPGMSVQEIMVPASKAGLVIGKGGETIKQLQVRCTNAVKPETIIYLVWSTFFFFFKQTFTY